MSAGTEAGIMSAFIPVGVYAYSPDISIAIPFR
jgi:hypothetical protein